MLGGLGGGRHRLRTAADVRRRCLSSLRVHRHRRPMLDHGPLAQLGMALAFPPIEDLLQLVGVDYDVCYG